MNGTDISLEELREKCKDFLSTIVTKEVNGETIYSPKIKKGISIHPIGYYKTEYQALFALHMYLVHNGRI